MKSFKSFVTEAPEMELTPKNLAAISKHIETYLKTFKIKFAGGKFNLKKAHGYTVYEYDKLLNLPEDSNSTFLYTMHGGMWVTVSIEPPASGRTRGAVNFKLSIRLKNSGTHTAIRDIKYDLSADGKVDFWDK